MAADKVAKLARAKGYPYARPESSYIFLNGEVYLFPDASWEGQQGLAELQVTHPELQVANRLEQVVSGAAVSASVLSQPLVPVLAIGSNAAPQQLTRKFPAHVFPGSFMIPVVRAVLEDFDVVYAPLLASYGSCAATLEWSPGTSVELFVTYLAPALLRKMHSTEGSYNLVSLSHIRLHVGSSLAAFRAKQRSPLLLTSILQYNHQLGSCHLPQPQGKASPIALQEIPAFHRQLPSKDQVSMLLAIYSLLEGSSKSSANSQQSNGLVAASHGEETETGRRVTLPDRTFANSQEGLSLAHLDLWILEHIESLHTQCARNAALAELAGGFQYPHAEIVSSLGDLPP